MNHFTDNSKWLDHDGRFLKGKYKGESADDVVEENPNYIRWVVEEVESLDDEDRETLQYLLDSRGSHR